MTPLTVLVTGGAGFIGSHLVDALVEQGHAVRVLDNLSSGSMSNLASVRHQVTFVEGDIRDRALVDRAMSGTDIVFHLAALVSVPHSMEEPALAMEINTTATLGLLTVAERAGVRRVVLSSTCAVYGGTPQLPVPETALPRPMSPYAISKLAAEHLCTFYNEFTRLETVTLRYFNVYGPRQVASSSYSGVISIFIDRLQRGQPVTIYGDGAQTRDFIHVSDVVRANLQAATVPEAAGQTFNVGTGHSTSISELYAVLAASVECDRPPAYEQERSGEVRHSRADVEKASRILSWHPSVQLTDGLQQLLH